MNSVSAFYFNSILGKKVYINSNKYIGKVIDLIIETGYVRPKVVAITIKTNGLIKSFAYSEFNMLKEKGKYVFKCSKLIDFVVDKTKTFSINKNILNKKIVDVNGKKLVKVQDLRLAFFRDETFLIAADVGFEGLLRRIGLVKLVRHLIKPFNLAIHSQYILWDEVDIIDFGDECIKLSKESSSLATLHPSDLADIIEDMDNITMMNVFNSLDDEKAADVLEELEIDAQISLLKNLSVEKAADILEKMPADEVADILDELKEEKAEELLNEMDDISSEEVRELMEYEDDTVGSIMSTDFISFPETYTVQETIEELRKLKPESDIAYYLYIVTADGKLISTVSLRAIIVAEPTVLLKDLIKKNIIFVKDTDNINIINDLLSKYNLLAIPVVDSDQVLVGMVEINDVMYNLLND